MTKEKVRLFVAIIAVLFVFGCSPTESPSSEIVFDLSIKEDASPKVLSKILESKEASISSIKFEKGVYHFYPDKAYEQFVHISNHNDVVITTAFPLFGLNNLEIDGQGSTFIYHGRMIPFLIDHCSNISIKNVTVDWAMSFHSEGLVVANNPKEKSFDLKISDEYPYIIRDGQLIFVKEYYEHGIGQAILYDTTRNAIAFNTESYTPVTNWSSVRVKRNLEKIQYKYELDKRSPREKSLQFQNGVHMKEVKPGVVRIYNHRRALPPVGNIMVCKGESNTNRLSPAFRVSFTDGCFMNNVTIHHAGGMGVIAENSSDLIFDKLQIVPSNGRMVSTTADATHFVGCRGKVELNNCTFNNQLDDALNVHGTYQIVQDILDENKLGVRMGHFQQKGFSIGRVADTVGVVRLSESFFPFEEMTIKNIKYINGRYQIITFNEKLPANIKPGDLIENLEAYPELLVQNCNISRNRARGLLLSTPRKTVIRGNYFSTEMEALLIPVESSFWYESGSASNLLIESNTFQDCNHSGLNRGIIRFETDDNNHNIAFQDIVIRNNKINHFDNLFLEVSNTDKLLFEGNIITHSTTFPQLFSSNPAIVVESSNQVEFKNNFYKGSAKTILKSPTDSTLKFN